MGIAKLKFEQQMETWSETMNNKQTQNNTHKKQAVQMEHGPGVTVEKHNAPLPRLLFASVISVEH